MKNSKKPKTITSSSFGFIQKQYSFDNKFTKLITRDQYNERYKNRVDDDVQSDSGTVQSSKKFLNSELQKAVGKFREKARYGIQNDMIRNLDYAYNC